MGTQYLLFKERQGLATIVAVTLQCVLERTTGDTDIEYTLSEIEDAVRETVAAIRGRSCLGNVGIAATSTTATTSPEPPPREDALYYASDSDLPQPNLLHGTKTMLPLEVLRRMMIHLTHLPGSRCFAELTAASAVCQRWRSVALSSPELWSEVHCSCPGDMRALATILRRSAKASLRVELDLHRIPEHVRPSALFALIPHMHRIKILILRDSGTFVRYEPLLSSRAPILEELHLHLPKRSQLAANFLGGYAPRLKALTIAMPYTLPRSCAALGSLTTLRLLDESSALSISQVAHLVRLCPRLASLRIDGTLRSAARGAAHDVRGLRELTLSAGLARTLSVFASDAVPHVHLRAAPKPAAGALANEVLDGAEHLFFARDARVVVLRDKDRRTRTLSELAPPTFDFLLTLAWAASARLTSLCVPDRVARGDAGALSGVAFPALRSFAVFVRAPHAPAGADTHVFDIHGATRRPWAFPALEDVRFATTPAVRDRGVFPDVPAGARPELSAAALRQFYVDMMQSGVTGKPSLTMVGVVFAERFAGPEVGALRTTFSAVHFI